MAPVPAPVGHATERTKPALRRVLGGMSVFTLLNDGASGLHDLGGSPRDGRFDMVMGAYLLSALLWFWYGIRKRDKNIYLSCVGWIVLDIAVIIGIVVHA